MNSKDSFTSDAPVFVPFAIVLGAFVYYAVPHLLALAFGMLIYFGAIWVCCWVFLGPAMLIMRALKLDGDWRREDVVEKACLIAGTLLLHGGPILYFVLEEM